MKKSLCSRTSAGEAESFGITQQSTQQMQADHAAVVKKGLNLAAVDSLAHSRKGFTQLKAYMQAGSFETLSESWWSMLLPSHMLL
eukprot:4927274-Amphidinium_carterae.1